MDHPVAEAVFLGFLALTLASAGFVAVSQNIVRSAFALLLTFSGVAGIYVFLGADFLAGAQLLIYVGGILVLLLFAVMLTNRIGDARVSNESRGRKRAAATAGAVFAVLAMTALAMPWPSRILAGRPTTPLLGEALLTDYVLPFEAISVLLLVVMVGAAVIARRDWKRAP